MSEQPTVQQPLGGQLPPPAAPTGAVPPGYVPAGYVPPGYVLARTGGFGRFVRHRATQLVAVGLAGLIVGGGVVGIVEHAHNDHRPGIARQQFQRGPGFQRHGQFPNGPGRGQNAPGNNGPTGNG